MSDTKLGKWSGGRRPVEEIVGDYDWDGALRPGCAEIDVLLSDSYEEIARTFWTQYLGQRETAHLRGAIHGEKLRRRIADSTVYVGAKFATPYGAQWIETAIQ